MIKTGTKGLFNFIDELQRYTEWDEKMDEWYNTPSQGSKPENFKARLCSLQVGHRVELSMWKDRLKGMQDVLEIEERQLDTILEVERLRHPLRIPVLA